ncbi:hypothetical protein HanIR_Chr15g0750221 [Helianthus annuus]|nr:hypothetical protein HanIR_Chr15g0750221 [Helianthus annuus]
MALSELPPSLMASLANSFHFPAFFLISKLLFPSSITSFKHKTTSSLFTIPVTLSTLTLTPTHHTSFINLASVNWSAHFGTPTIGTPRLNPSSVEFHPQ